MQSAFWDAMVVRDTGMQKGRSRWQLGAEKARHRSLEAAGYLIREDGKLEKDSEGGYITIDKVFLNEMRSDRWELYPEFKEVPSELIEPESWKRVEQGVWHHSDAIHNLEARDLTKVCDRLGNVVSISESKVLILGDNVAVALAFSRRRANDFKLLCLIRRMCAVGLLKGSKFFSMDSLRTQRCRF